MRCLVSSTCLLLQIIAMLALLVSRSVSKTTACHLLDEEGNLFEQMESCTGSMFQFRSSTNPVFDLSQLKQAEADTILFEKNIVNEPDPEKPRAFAGHVKIVGSILEKLTLRIAAATGKEQNVEIVNNTKLNYLKLVSDGAPLKLILKGNKELSKSSIRTANKLSGINNTTSEIQGYHECYFGDAAVKNLSDLVGCSSIGGDLIIDGNTDIPDPLPSIRIKKIRKGCLRIENSRLTSIGFLEGLLAEQTKEKCAASGQPQIKGNTLLCINSEDRSKWDRITPVDYAGTTCLDRCTVDFAKKNPTQTIAPCDVVMGDVQITGSPSATDLAHWDRVKILEGTLEVSGTNLQDVVIFKNLEKIINPSPEKIALVVIKNPQMTKFNLPKLANITMPPDSLSEPIFFQDNGDFKFTVAEDEKWKQIANRIFIMIPVEPPTTTAVPTTSAATTMSSKQIDDLNKKIEDENEKTKRDEKLIIGIVILVLFILSSAIGIGMVWLCDRICKKRKLAKKSNDLATSILLIAKKSKANNKKGRGKKGEVSDDKTMALVVQDKQLEMSRHAELILRLDAESIQNRQDATRDQMALAAEEIPFKMDDIIKNLNAPELDIEKARSLLKQHKLPKMKHTGKPYRHIYQYKFLFFSSITMNHKPVPYISKYNRITVFKYLITHCSEFFLTNAHLLPDVIADCSGPYYTPNGTLLAEVDGPVYVIGDLHEALHVLQTILNLDLFGEGKKHKIHPMFRHKYIFLGDYLDRGYHGLEVFFLLCIAARLFPELFTVLRGNHDGCPPFYGDKEMLMNRYGDSLKKKETNIDNPRHFAECMITDIHTKVTPYLPMAAIINGQTFAAHGGLTLGMAIGKKSIREIFKEIPVPYYDVSRYKNELLLRYFSLETPFPHGYFDVTKIDQYKLKLDNVRDELQTWQDERKQYEKKTDPNIPRDPRFESPYPGLNSVMWSDPSPAFASAGNVRQAGCTYNTEFVLKMIENNKSNEANKSIEDIIRAHQVVGIAHSCDDRVTTVFSNCNHTQFLEGPPEDLNYLSSLRYSASILRINEDGSRTIILMSITGKKKAKQALVNADSKIKRRVHKHMEDEKKEDEEEDEQEDEKEDKKTS